MRYIIFLADDAVDGGLVRDLERGLVAEFRDREIGRTVGQEDDVLHVMNHG